MPAITKKETRLQLQFVANTDHSIHAGLVDPSRIPQNGTCVVRIWQANIQKTIIAHVPVTNGQVQRRPGESYKL